MRYLFIHNTAMWYRIPFFKRLSESFNVKFIFTDFDIIGDVYEESYKNTLEDMEGLDFKIVNSTVDLVKDLISDYDVIIGGSWASIPEICRTFIIYLIAKLRHKKIILFSEEWNWRFSFKRKLIIPIVKFFVTIADAVLVPGSIHKIHFIDVGADPNKIFIMPNATKIKVIKKEPDEKIVLYVGRLIKIKGVDYLIESFKKINDREASLLIVGYGEDEERLKNLANEAKNIVFAGKVSQEDLHKYYSKASVVVAPSVERDAWVFVLNEAMMHGKPVIATTAVGGAYDLIKDGVNGFIVPEKNVDELSRAIKKILDDPSLQRKMGEASLKIISEGFTYEKMVEGFKRAIDYVMDK